MSVFTTLNQDEVRDWFSGYGLGALIKIEGIAAGITNTNYFLHTADSRYVLTIFEQNAFEELPYFVDLMTHLAERGIACPAPIKDQQGVALHTLKGKPALMVSCLKGRDVEQPNIAQITAVATTLANMHNAGVDFKAQSHNQRDITWRNHTGERVLSKLTPSQTELLNAEMAYQDGLALSALPQGVIHGDLFRDNVLFDGDKLGGFIDFYYACQDVLAYDVAISVNEWCAHADGTLDAEKYDAFMQAYQAKRPFTQAETQLFPALLRRAALRFWLSRLYDFYYPQDGELTHAKDPAYFERLLQNRVALDAVGQAN